MKLPADYKFELVTVALVGAAIGIVPFLIVLTATKNLSFALVGGSIVPLLFLAKSASSSLSYALSTAADHRYRYRAFCGEMMADELVEDEVVKVVLRLFELNEQEAVAVKIDSGPPAEARQSYSCSMAVPKEVWEKGAAESAKRASWLVLQANDQNPGNAAKLLTRAAVIFSNITMGLRFNDAARLYREQALPLLPRILRNLEQSNLPQTDRLNCLQHVASIAQTLHSHTTACNAYEQLLPWIKDPARERCAAAALLSNYAYSAQRSGKQKYARALKAEANKLWQGIPQAVIESEMLR